MEIGMMIDMAWCEEGTTYYITEFKMFLAFRLLDTKITIWLMYCPNILDMTSMT